MFAKEAIQKAGKIPKFQTLLLTELPPELIHCVFSRATHSQARLLASTYKLLKNMGVSYLYHGILALYELEPENVDEADLEDIAEQQSRTFTRQINFLISRPDLTDVIQNLSIADGVKQDWNIFTSSELRPYDRAFYLPIYASTSTLLSACHNLTHLDVAHWTIASDWLKTISHLKSLHTLKFRSAHVEDPATEDGIAHGHIPPSPHVLNVWWIEGSDDWERRELREPFGEGLWYTLLLFPNLLTFGHRAQRIEGRIPSQLTQEKYLHFWNGPLQLQTSPAPSCTLTHFKLHRVHSILDSSIVPLLEALHALSAPLQVLVLEGIKEGALTLMQCIADLFPDLLGPTLIRRENLLQRRTELARWPYQCGDYALQLRNFRKLKYFGWNFHVPLYDLTPALLLALKKHAMRDANPDHFSNKEELHEALLQERESSYFQDAGSIALPLAAHCPTLEVMGLEREFVLNLVLRGTLMEVVYESILRNTDFRVLPIRGIGILTS
ncbi:hypothetical protein AAF712_006629 [Marasmius tenuissimus]|uniref:F-box domain-containing protein n=1 Tax=Marasmius tenuissimus TaxID=585030 RepID=A0ABR2ZYF9_9AGAR